MEEWLIVADRGRGLMVQREGFSTPREAAGVRQRLEARLHEDDTVNLLVLTRADFDRLVAEELAVRAAAHNQPNDQKRLDTA